MSIYLLDDFIGMELTVKEKAFVDSLHGQLERYGRMTDKQVEYLYILRERKGIVEGPWPDWMGMDIKEPTVEEIADKKARYAAADKETKAFIKTMMDSGMIKGLRDVNFY